MIGWSNSHFNNLHFKQLLKQRQTLDMGTEQTTSFAFSEPLKHTLLNKLDNPHANAGVYVYKCVHTYIYIYICDYSAICLYLSISLSLYVIIYIHICIYICIYIYIYIYIYLSIYIYIYVCAIPAKVGGHMPRSMPCTYIYIHIYTMFIGRASRGLESFKAYRFNISVGDAWPRAFRCDS